MLRALLCGLAILATPAFSEPVEIKTFQGVVATPAQPEKIVVFDVSALDTLDALGVKPDGVVRPVFVDYLNDVTENADVVGSLFEPDFEAIAAMQPDLIIAGGRSQRAIPDLEKIAPTIDMTIWGDVVPQALDRLEAYGQIFGKHDEAAALRATFDAKLQETRNAVNGQGRALILMTNGPKVSAYGGSGRFGWLHSTIGLPEAVDGMTDTAHGEAVSFEFIREANPDILIVIDRQAAIGQGNASAAATLDNALVHDTNAWKNGKVIYLDSARIYVAGGGIQSLIQTMDQIASAF